MAFNFDEESLEYHGRKVLSLLGDLLKEPRFSQRKERIIQGITKNEIVTEADHAAEQLVIDYIKQNNIPVNLDGEEKRRSVLTQSPKGLGSLDPIDGTYNYYKGIFPFVSILSFFTTPSPERLGDAAWAGMINHDNGQIITTNSPLKTSGRKTLDGDLEASVVIDLGPKQKLEAYRPYEEIIKNSWWRNVSCAGIHFFGVANGNIDLYICPVQKPEELVAGIPLIEKAGGAVITSDGRRAGDLLYDFDKKYSIIAAATPELAYELAEKYAK